MNSARGGLQMDITTDSCGAEEREGAAGGRRKEEGIRSPEQLIRLENVWKIFFII